MAAECVPEAVARARARRSPRHVAASSPRVAAGGRSFCASRPWRATVKDAVVQLVELPLDTEGTFADVADFKPDHLTPADTGVAHRHDGDKLVIPTGQQGGALGEQQ